MADVKDFFRITAKKMTCNSSSLRVSVLQRRLYRQAKAMQEEERARETSYRRNLAANLQNVARNRPNSSLRAQISREPCNPQGPQPRSERSRYCGSRKRSDVWLIDAQANSQNLNRQSRPDAKRQKSATQHQMTSTPLSEDDLAKSREALQSLAKNL